MPPRRIAIYGNTIALAGIALALEHHPNWSLVTLQVDDLNLAHQLAKLSPDIIIFDAALTDAQTILACSEERHNLLAIGVEENSNRMVLWSGRSARALTTRDLCQAIDTLPALSYRLSLSDQARQWITSWQSAWHGLRWTRRRKLEMSMVLIVLGLVIVLTQALDNPNEPVPLVGTAIGGVISVEVVIAFLVGILVGSAVLGLGLWLSKRAPVRRFFNKEEKQAS